MKSLIEIRADIAELSVISETGQNKEKEEW